jgi:hypothetical protein
MSIKIDFHLLLEIGELYMTNVQFDQLITVLSQLAINTDRIATCLEQQIRKEAPNYQRDIKDFRAFDWNSIGAIIEQSDQFGAAVVEWGGKLYRRRSPQNKFGAAVWFSRCTGKNEDGANVYERLITFKGSEAPDPLPGKTASLVGL